MRKILIILPLITSVFAFYACSDKKHESSTQISYFDLKGFINNEVQSLTDANPDIIKSVKVNGRKEQDKIKIEDWERELSAFTQADINKPALVGRYNVDSNMVNGKLARLSYIAQKKDLKTRELVIYFDSGQPNKIEITLAKKNMLFQNDQHLAYTPNTGYSISGKQIIKFMGETSFSVETEFQY